MINLMNRFKAIEQNCFGKVLDLGATETELHNYLKGSKNVKEIIGIDLVKSENVNIIHDLNKYPYPIDSEFFDSVVAGEIIEHLNEPFNFLLEIKKS